MNTKIENLSTCEIRLVIQCVNSTVGCALLAEFHRQIVQVYDEGAMNGGNVRKWCPLFKEVTTNVHDEEKYWRPSLFTDDLKEKAKLQWKKRFKISKLHENLPDTSPSVIPEIVRIF
jgi:hypothetical protein